jgi:Ca2+-binding RTX toxin-like protein
MKKGTRRGVLLLASMLVMLVVVGGVAWALNIVGTDRDDNLRGTSANDRIRGLGGNDFINGLSGADIIWGEAGNDELVDGARSESFRDQLYGGSGNDTIWTNNRPYRRDVVNCGPGFDTLVADPYDAYVGQPCEDVIVRR